MGQGDAILEVVRRKVKLETTDAYWQDGPNFFFKAKSISEDFICKEMMEILADQAHGASLVFRHRHPEGNTEKIVPIFGRGVEGQIVLEEGKRYMETVYRVETENKFGHPIPHQRMFADWVQSRYDDGNPIAISLNFITYRDVLEDGKFLNYWVTTVEHTGTSYPACDDCRNYTGEEAIAMVNEDDEKKKKSQGKFTGMTAEQLELQLEKMTLEKDSLESELQKLEGEKATLQKKVTEQESLVSKLQDDGDALKKQVLELATSLSTIKEDLEYAKTVKPLIDEIIKLEGRPELEQFYREKVKEVDSDGKPLGLKYLQAHLEKLSKPVAQVSQLNPMQKMLEARDKQLEMNEITKEKVLENVDPSLRQKMKEFLENGGSIV